MKEHDKAGAESLLQDYGLVDMEVHMLFLVFTLVTWYLTFDSGITESSMGDTSLQHIQHDIF